MTTSETTKRPRWSRRTVLKAAGSTLGVLAISPFPAPAIAQARRKVTLVYGVQTIDSAADGFFASIPLGMGFYEEEGLDVEIQTVAGAAAAVNLLASGRAQFSTHGTAGIFAGAGRGVPMKSFICQVVDYFTSIGVLKDGPIQKLEDLKGKTIGISAIGGAPTLIMKAAMRKLGWNPETDVELLAVGTALPALDALRRNRVQALVVWDSIFALFEFHGGDFRYFRPDPIPQIGFTHSTNTLIDTIEKDPDLVARMSRALAKSIVVMAAAEPAELTKLHFKMFPASKPTGLDDADLLRLDALRLNARRQFMRLPQRVFERTEKLGDVSDSQIAGLRDLLFEGGEIPQPLPVERYFTRQFLDQMNSFDVPALIEKARLFKV
jgi:NitT/TauT family transport system substrate-binding protein